MYEYSAIELPDMHLQFCDMTLPPWSITDTELLLELARAENEHECGF